MKHLFRESLRDPFRNVHSYERAVIEALKAFYDLSPIKIDLLTIDYDFEEPFDAGVAPESVAASLARRALRESRINEGYNRRSFVYFKIDTKRMRMAGYRDAQAALQKLADWVENETDYDFYPEVMWDGDKGGFYCAVPKKVVNDDLWEFVATKLGIKYLRLIKVYEDEFCEKDVKDKYMR